MLKLLNLVLLQVCNSPCPRCFLVSWVFCCVAFFFSIPQKPSLKFTYCKEEFLEQFLLSLNHLWPHKPLCGILNQPTSKKAAMEKTPSLLRHTISWAEIFYIQNFTHLLFLSFPGFLLLQFYLLWKKFLHYLVRNKGVQIPKGKDKEEEHQCITRMNL